jgi:nucleotidyltransferase substrate binding protein (TIGR01987 family)
MEIIEKKYNTLKKALESLRKSLVRLQDPQHQDLYDGLRDSVIQRFEYCIDSFWKFLKFYIQEKENIDLEASSPRIILRRAEEIGIINKELHDILIDCVADRNLTSHVYNEETADTIVKNVPHYYETMKSIIDNIDINKK